MESPSESAASTPRMTMPDSIQARRRSTGRSALNARRRTAIDQSPSASAADQRLRSMFSKIRLEMNGRVPFFLDSILGDLLFFSGSIGGPSLTKYFPRESIIAFSRRQIDLR